MSTVDIPKTYRTVEYFSLFSKTYVGINISKCTNNCGTPKMAVCTNNCGQSSTTYSGSGGNQKLSLFFVSYVGISIKKFAVGVSRWSYFLASESGTFLLVICMNLVIRNGPPTHVIENSSFVKIKVD